MYEASAGTLLRNNSMASKLFKSYAAEVGTEFLKQTLKEVIADVCKNASTGGASFEVRFV